MPLNIMPPIRTFDNRSFYPFPIDYSSETSAPLVRSDHQISHVRYLLRGQAAAQATIRTNQPIPTVRIPHMLHDNTPIVVTVPNATPMVEHIPTPILPPLVAPVRYVSPLLTQFNPCVGCGSADDNHFPGCTK